MEEAVVTGEVKLCCLAYQEGGPAYDSLVRCVSDARGPSWVPAKQNL